MHAAHHHERRVRRVRSTDGLGKTSGGTNLALIREALESYVSEQEAHLEPEPLPDWVGMLEGPGGPYAARDEEVLDASWAESIDSRDA